MKKKLFVLLVAVLPLTWGTAAFADLFVKETLPNGAGQNSGSLLLPVSGSAQNYFTGYQNIKVSPTGTDIDATSFIAYCVDPMHYSSTSYLDNFTPSAAHSVASLFTTQAVNIQKLYDKYFAGTLGNNANAAAFQLALWEIAKDNQILTSGSVQTNGSTLSSLVTNAQTLLSGYASYSGPQIYNLTLYEVNRSIAGASGQDYIVASPVPEPSTGMLLVAGLGLAGLAVTRGRSKKN